MLTVIIPEHLDTPRLSVPAKINKNTFIPIPMCSKLQDQVGQAKDPIYRDNLINFLLDFKINYISALQSNINIHIFKRHILALQLNINIHIFKREVTTSHKVEGQILKICTYKNHLNGNIKKNKKIMIQLVVYSESFEYLLVY